MYKLSENSDYDLLTLYKSLKENFRNWNLYLSFDFKISIYYALPFQVLSCDKIFLIFNGIVYFTSSKPIFSPISLVITLIALLYSLFSVLIFSLYY